LFMHHQREAVGTMEECERTCLCALAPSGARINVWTTTPGEARSLAEALHDARPSWRVSIDGQVPVFSREGKLVDLTTPRSAR
jgi:hypothetical protein